MITYEEALKKAKEKKPDIDNCVEYENGYVFGCHDDDNYTGGGHVPCVIVKETGDAVSMPVFITTVGSGEQVRSFDL